MRNDIYISPKYYQSLAHTFSPTVMNALIDNGQSRYLTEVLVTSGLLNSLDISINMRKFFEWLYNFISGTYRNEYVYKNAIANKILLGRHSLNTSCMLTEFRVGNCKADVVILNNTSTVYEIKSEYDSFDRVKEQVTSYMQMFDRVNVISSSSQLNKLATVLPLEIGMMELTPKNTIHTVREATSVKKGVVPAVIFNSLRKPEYLSIIKKIFGYIPDVPNTRIYRECLELFCTLLPEIAHDEMVRTLYKRRNRKSLSKYIHTIPFSLRGYIIGSRVNDGNLIKLSDLLETKLEAVLVPIN